MLVAEQLFLLLRRDDGKAESAFAMNDYGLTGAVLADLLFAGHIALDEDKDPHVRVVAPDAVGHPVLDAALERLRKKGGKRLSSLIMDGKLNPSDRVGESLAAAGIVEVHPKKALGLVGSRYPVLDPAPERALRERLRSVLSGASAQRNEAALLGLLKAMSLARNVLKEERGTLSRKELDRRIDEVAAHDVVGKAVGQAIAALAATLAAVTIVAAASGSS